MSVSNGFGAIAKRLCNGLQIRLAQFDSGSRLQHLYTPVVTPQGYFFAQFARATHTVAPCGP